MKDLHTLSFSQLGSTNQTLFVKNLDEFVGSYHFDYNRTHKVDFSTMVICTGGESKYMLDFITVNLKEGDVLFLSPGQVFYCLEPRKISGIIVSYTADFFNTPYHETLFKSNFDLFIDLSQRYSLHIPISRRPNLYGIIELLKMEIEYSHLRNTNLILQHLVSALLQVFSREKAHLVKEEVFVAEKSLASKYKLMVQNNISVKNNVEYFCNELKISKSTLQKATRLTLNKTPKDIIEEVLLLEAKRLMIISSARIQEIGFSLGFTDPTNFTKFFKRNVGMTPESFRRTQHVNLLAKEKV